MNLSLGSYDLLEKSIGHPNDHIHEAIFVSQMSEFTL